MRTIFPNRIVSAIIVFLALTTIVSVSAYVARGKVAAKEAQVAAAYDRSKGIMAFQKLFVADVLDSNGTVDDATRAELDQAADGTNDPAVIAAWNAFLSAQTEAAGQAAVTSLLSVIATEASQ